ncbi:MAG: thioredoxin domain-containing protein [Syntrophales bacterium]|nr:thioredoxin domain-containing protein [Syntrophales bacterium]
MTPNRLVKEKSPYLLQHAANPVDWYPWGDEAFQRAKTEDKPIFLSIGYATCHWCHVMAHESFEDGEVARLLKESYISVKVDREERPDIDNVYMLVCQALTGQGGWPLSIFLTPEGKPFFAGTYFPKRKRMGMSGFVELLTQIASLWQNDRARILRSGEEVAQAIQPRVGPMSEEHTLGWHTLQKGYEGLARSFDPKWGGFGNAPKFPLPHQLTFLLRWHRRGGDTHALAMVEKTLDSMRRGGIFDQIAFGFHRYSMDEKWLVPHFEKMLYDQALLAMAYTEAYQATGNKSHAAVVHEILSYVLREMTAPEGGFYSAEDADSEGKEGLFYLWKPDEIKECLGNELGELFCDFYDISERGNFENGYSIPRVPLELKNFAVHKGMDPEELDAGLRSARERIFDLRKMRVHPLKDDKVLTSWNGLMIAALAKAFCATGEPAYSGAACQAADFIIRNMKKANGRLYHRYREGEAAHHAFLDDYAFLVWGYIELYEATFEIRYLEEALAMNAVMLNLFWDESAGGLFFTGPDNEALIVRTKDIQDGALPSGNSVALMNLLRLGRMTGNIELEEKADQLAQAFGGEIAAFPVAYTQFLSALDFMFGPSQEIIIAGNAAQESTWAMIEAVHRMFLPNKVLVFRPEGDEGDRLSAISPFLATLRPLENRPTVYLCEKNACKTPIFDIEELKSVMGGDRK